jgi:hypothetical protein
MSPNDAAHRQALSEAAKALYRSLDRGATKVGAANHKGRADDVSEMTPEEEVLLLHVLE